MLIFTLTSSKWAWSPARATSAAASGGTLGRESRRPRTGSDFKNHCLVLPGSASGTGTGSDWHSVVTE
jgi:hypothetical protein